MSITVLKAFGERPRIGARKLPAAPALGGLSAQIAASRNLMSCFYISFFDPESPTSKESYKEAVYSHTEIQAPQLFHTSVCSILQTLGIPHINSPDAQNLCSWACCGDVYGHRLCFLDIATDDAGISAEVDEGADLGRTDCAGATSAEEDFVVCGRMLGS